MKKNLFKGESHVHDCFFENFFQKNENIYQIGIKYMIILTIPTKYLKFFFITEKIQNGGATVARSRLLQFAPGNAQVLVID